MEELKEHLNFKLTIASDVLERQIYNVFDVLFIHEDCLKDNNIKKKLLEQKNNIKILISRSVKKNIDNFADVLILPTKIEDINKIIEDTVIKKDFSKNSSIKIKEYVLDKNEKKLSKNNVFIPLTEKEIQLLELFLTNIKSISKIEILGKVWKYSADADTHTVETHIYRLRKKISEKFNINNLIISDHNGYRIKLN